MSPEPQSGPHEQANRFTRTLRPSDPAAWEQPTHHERTPFLRTRALARHTLFHTSGRLDSMTRIRYSNRNRRRHGYKRRRSSGSLYHGGGSLWKPSSARSSASRRHRVSSAKRAGGSELFAVLLLLTSGRHAHAAGTGRCAYRRERIQERLRSAVAAPPTLLSMSWGWCRHGRFRGLRSRHPGRCPAPAMWCPAASAACIRAMREWSRCPV